MNLSSRAIENVNVLELSGRFDSYVAPQVSDWLEHTVASGSTQILVNMAGVNFVDSTALATLVQGLKRCRQRNGELHLCTLQQPVAMIFELTRLDKAFNIFVDEQHALQAFAN